MTNEINYTINIRIFGCVLVLGNIILAFVIGNLFFMIGAAFCMPLALEITR